MILSKNTNDFEKNQPNEFLDLKLTFSSMNKGELSYNGEYKGKKVYATASESFVINFDFSSEETPRNLAESEYCTISIDSKLVFNNH